MEFKNTATKLVYQDIKTRYNKATINKHELASELSISEATIDRYIKMGYGIPPYTRIGNQTKANASQRWAIVDVAEYIAGNQVKMDHDASFEIPELDLGDKEELNFDIPEVDLGEIDDYDISNAKFGELDE